MSKLTNKIKSQILPDFSCATNRGRGLVIDKVVYTSDGYLDGTRSPYEDLAFFQMDHWVLFDWL